MFQHIFFSVIVLTLSVHCTVSCSAIASDQIPGKLPKTPVALVGGTIYPVSSAPIENGTLIFDQGKITDVGADIEIPEGVQVVKANKMHIYPGLFESYSQIGLVEVNAVRASNDHREAGEFNPNVLAQVSFNPDSELIPVTRSNGVLLNMSVPTGGLISGQAAVMQLDGWTFEEMTVKPRAAMIVSLPNEKEAKELHEFLEVARRYQLAAESKTKLRHDLRLEAMLPVLAGQQPIIIRANKWQDINRAVSFSKNENIKLILFGGYDAPKCAELLKKHDIPVILSAIHRKPLYRHDAYDAAFTLPQQLQDLGIRFCISGYDRSSSYNVRNLPYHAATAVAFGLSQENALKAITLSPAEILGVDDRVGSLSVGKDATLFVSTGNPLETSSQVKQAWIGGRPVDLGDKQKTLHQKYQKKYEEE